MIMNSAAPATTINPDADCVTLINVFTVDAEKQAELIEALDRATVVVIAQRPGFISANIHVGLDGTKVANYARWASVDDFTAMLADPTCREHMDQASALASFAPELYRVHSVHRTTR